MTIDKAIYILRNTAWLGTDGDMESVEQAVKMAVEALERSKWIPCSEGMPRTEAICCDKCEEMIIACVYTDKTSDTGFSAESDTECMYNCVAWMPLPEPYQPKEESE